MNYFSNNEIVLKKILLWIIYCILITQTSDILEAYQINSGDSSGVKAEINQLNDKDILNSSTSVDIPNELSGTTRLIKNGNAARFESKRHLFRKLMGVPRDIWTLTFYQIGNFVIWGERVRIDQQIADFFLNDDRTSGVFPLLTVGGNTGTSVGTLIFNNNLFERDVVLSGFFLYNTPENLSLGSSFSSPVLSNKGKIYAALNFWEDEEEFLFDIGNNTILSKDSLAYGIKEKYFKTGFEYTKTKSSGRFVNSKYQQEKRPGRMNFMSIDSYIKYRTVTIDSGGSEFRAIANKITGFGEESSIEGGISLTYDSRNRRFNPFMGSLIRLSGILSEQLNGDEFGFLRYTLEYQRYFAIYKNDRIISFRAILDETHTPGDKVIPFYDMSVLGNANTLRGYKEGRFRDFGSVLFNIEYRYPIWDTWDGVLFLDQGEVFKNLGDISIGGFHRGYGFGLRLRTKNSFLARAQLGRSKEGIRFILQFTQIFD